MRVGIIRTKIDDRPISVDCLVEPSKAPQGIAEIHERESVVRLSRERLPIMGDGVFKFADGTQRDPEVDLSMKKIRPCGQGFFKFDDPVVYSAQTTFGEAQVDMRLHELWIDCERLAVADRGILRLSTCIQNDTQVVVRIGVTRIDLDGPR